MLWIKNIDDLILRRFHLGYFVEFADQNMNAVALVLSSIKKISTLYSKEHYCQLELREKSHPFEPALLIINCETIECLTRVKEAIVSFLDKTTYDIEIDKNKKEL